MTSPIRKLSTQEQGFEETLQGLLDWQDATDHNVVEIVSNVITQVRKQGDQAVLELTEKFDGLEAPSIANLEISKEQLEQAKTRISQHHLDILERSAARIKHYHEHQREQSWSFEDDLGNHLGQKISPLENVGVYVPGGQASYPSSVLMTLIPAKVAGVENLIVTVPTPQGIQNDMVLAALAVAGADRVFTIGGAQAVAALAYGTESIPRVDKIVGPGGAFVAEAKKQVFGQVGIDIIAGPSEVLIIADGTTNPEWAALDLFSQAEHDAAAQAILLSPNREFIDTVAQHMTDRLPSMQRAETIEASLKNRGALIETNDLDEAIRLANQIAPEHLELHVQSPEQLVDKIKHAGAIFCGAYAGETLGDYVAGPSHVLPTFGTARYGSPLGVYDFVKRSSVIHISAQGAAELADIAVPFAETEGLQAHGLAAALRAQQNSSS